MKRVHSATKSDIEIVANENRDRKRARRGYFLDLPNDLIFRILSLLSRSDVIKFSCMNRHYRSELSPIIFNKVKTNWYELISKKEEPRFDLFSLPEYIRLVDFYSYGEWQIDIFSILHLRFPRLTHLSINSANSSNWLKYRTSSYIKELCLYYEKGHNETQDLQHEPNPKNILKLSRTASNSPRIFDLAHLHDFKLLTKLSLDSYHFNWSESANICCSLLELNLLNCTWEYPFTLAQFNLSRNLKSLKLKYIENHPFILSERFGKFLEDPKGNVVLRDRESGGEGEVAELSYYSLDTLETFLLSFDQHTDSTWRKLLSTKQLSKFNSQSFPKLKNLELSGFQMNLESYRSFTKILEDDFSLHRLKLAIWDTSRDTTNSTKEQFVLVGKSAIEKFGLELLE
ncbi:hypothetical protein CLIB1423_26S00804 [[Candida] railenensis]|uniref:F-box domain-containing protein n=1 Tax=[Candida] railenensis TaxID=45579 RepID=A0A9P0W0W4_9ASCO|nr:hypothetical protein CLIB1423_26S00804 [[Candida] railenensis]